MKKMFLILMGVVSLSFAGSVSAREIVPLMDHFTDSAPLVIRVKAETGKVRQMTGVVKGVDLAAGSLDLENRRGKKSFKIVGETQFKKGREELSLEDLRPGTQVVVKYRDLGDIKQARIIKLKEK